MMAETQLTWYGHSTYKLVTPKGKIVFIDPWLKNPAHENGEEILKKIERVDAIVLTHGHFDHVGDAVEIAKKTKAKLCCTFDCAAALQHALGYPADDGDYGGQIGGAIPMFDGEATARFARAWHGSSVKRGEDKTPVYGGTATGVGLAITE